MNKYSKLITIEFGEILSRINRVLVSALILIYGILKPKIIIQSKVLKDDDLLKFVLIHELTHIRRFDMVFTHIKNLIVCLYWYNIFILIAYRHTEEDIEVLCDKLVVERIGDTAKIQKRILYVNAKSYRRK